MKRFDMSTILPVWVSIILIVAGCAEAQQPGDIEATTTDGRKVILHSNGTWVYKVSVLQKKISSTLTKPPQATKVIKSKKGFYEIWIDPTKWIPATKPDHLEAELTFMHSTKDAWAMAIAERVGGPISTLKDIAIENAKQVAPDVKVVFEKERIVNGTKVLHMRLDGTIKGIQFTYYGYYWAGKAGNLQVITYTGTNLFDEFKEDFTNFLNGLVILKK